MNKYSGAKFQGSESSSLDSKNAADSVAGGTVCVENGSVGLSVGTPLDSLSDTDSGGATSLQSKISSSLSTARLCTYPYTRIHVLSCICDLSLNF